MNIKSKQWILFLDKISTLTKILPQQRPLKIVITCLINYEISTLDLDENSTGYPTKPRIDVYLLGLKYNS